MTTYSCFAHDLDHFRVHAIRLDSCPPKMRGLSRVRELVEERGGHLRPAGVVNASKDDRLHQAFLWAETPDHRPA
jgi:hypothetical protein